jgi:hypothetical protein
MKGGKRTNVMMDVGIRRRERRTKTRSACQGMMYGRCLHCKFAFCRMVHSLCTRPLIFLHRRHPTGKFSNFVYLHVRSDFQLPKPTKISFIWKNYFKRITVANDDEWTNGRKEIREFKKNYVVTSKIILDKTLR